MTRFFAFIVAVAVLSASPAYAQAGNQPEAPTLMPEGEVALWTIAIKPDKTAEFEQVLAKLRAGLQKSAKPERQQQMAGWMVMRLPKPLPDGNIAYVHVLAPVVKGADYLLMNILYEEFPDERQAIYDLYRRAFAGNVSLAAGSVVIDMSKPQ